MVRRNTRTFSFFFSFLTFVLTWIYEESRHSKRNYWSRMAHRSFSSGGIGADSKVKITRHMKAQILECQRTRGHYSSIYHSQVQDPFVQSALRGIWNPFLHPRISIYLIILKFKTRKLYVLAQSFPFRYMS